MRNERRVQAAKLGKSPEAHCPRCSLVFQDGVWRRGKAQAGRTLQSKLCPACRQIRDGRPGGVVQLGGTFAALHRQDLLNRIRNVEALSANERPLERIMGIQEKNGQIMISATTEHLVARIGKAIQRDFGGVLELKYTPEDKFATARWHRDT